MSTAGKNYRSVLYLVLLWSLVLCDGTQFLENIICDLREPIDIIDSYKKRNSFINSDLDEFTLSLFSG